MISQIVLQISLCIRWTKSEKGILCGKYHLQYCEKLFKMTALTEIISVGANLKYDRTEDL